MKKWLIILTCLFSSSIWAADLIDVYRDAWKSDPTFQSARATRLANREVFAQARANLLPSLAGSASRDAHRVKSDETTALTAESTRSFHTTRYSLNLTQSLINYSNWMQLRSANNSVRQAEAAFIAAAQDLMIRTADRYFAILDAKDTLRFTVAEKKASAKQLDQAKQRFKVGLDPITSVHDAQARYDSVVAEEISAGNDVDNARESLREITGRMYKKINAVYGRLPLVRPTPLDVNEWVQSAEKRNFTLHAARYRALAARESVGQAFGGHLPSLDIVGTYDDVETEPTSLGETDTQSGVIGLRLNVPIFEGGAVSSRTRQAKYQYLAEVANFRTAKRTTISATHQSYNDVISGIGRVKADRQTVKSARSSLESSEASYRVGTRTFVDVLDAQSDLYDAQRILSTDEYIYINSILALKQAAGTLQVTDLEEINAWLHRRKGKGYKGKRKA